MNTTQIHYLDERLIDQKRTAQAARSLRESSGVAAGEVAKLTGISIPQICRPRKKEKRNWTAKTFEKYVNAVNKLTK